MNISDFSFSKIVVRKQKGWVSSPANDYFVDIKIHELHFLYKNELLIFRRFINNVWNGEAKWTSRFDYNEKGDLIEIRDVEILLIDNKLNSHFNDIWKESIKNH